MVGKKLRETVLGQPERRFVVPQRVVGVEAKCQDRVGHGASGVINFTLTPGRQEPCSFHRSQTDYNKDRVQMTEPAA